ncbi:MAG: M23 family metallopeptidase [Acidobacteriota bacterium]|nr:M23 family metallopeptidase [Acidobacteriota bacterium]
MQILVVEPSDNFANVIYGRGHQNKRIMKTLLILIVVILAFFAIVNNLPTASVEIERAKEKATASFRYAELLTKEPEAKIRNPIRKIKTKQIADTFGAPRGSDRTHKGQDIFAPRNTPVRSAVNGYVWRVGENNLGGNTIWIIGAGGRVYYYAHLEKYAENLKVGDAVTTDTIIGFVGTSGNAKGTPPHLHFGVYTQTGAVNPLSLLSDER